MPYLLFIVTFIGEAAYLAGTTGATFLDALNVSFGHAILVGLVAMVVSEAREVFSR